MDPAQFRQFIDAFQQLMQAQQQQQQNARPPAVTGGAKLRTLEKNDPVEWRQFRIHFETMMQVHQWADDTARGMLKASITGEALKVVMDVPIRAQGQTIQQMLDDYEARFTPAPQGRFSRTEYEEARQMPEESAIQWHGRLRELYQRGFPNGNAEADVGLIEKFVKRNKDIRVAQNIWARDELPQTYTAALHATQNVESSLMLQPEGATGGINYIPAADKGNNQGTKAKTCFVCRTPGHFAKDCFMLDRAVKYMQESQARKGDDNNRGQRRQRGRSRASGRGTTDRRQARTRIQQVGGEENEGELPPAGSEPITLAAPEN